MNINFDMDGTIADFYSVPNWLDSLENSDTRPYKEAKPLINMNSFARILNRLQKQGNKINIISWTSKCGTPQFNEQIAKVKRAWLKKHLSSVHFDNIFIVPYGEPKEKYSSGVLFDDEEPNRRNWNGKAYNAENIIETLKKF